MSYEGRLDADHTANDLPGYEMTGTLGEVFGLTVRSRNTGSQLGAGLKSIIGSNWTEICAFGTAVKARKA
jgi:uncharacterized protein YbjQ (UPF0145 family)